jgi:hypothetical protein
MKPKRKKHRSESDKRSNPTSIRIKIINETKGTFSEGRLGKIFKIVKEKSWHQPRSYYKIHQLEISKLNLGRDVRVSKDDVEIYDEIPRWGK